MKVNFLRSELRIRNYWKVASHADVLRGSSRVMSAWEAILKVVCLYNGSVQLLRTTIGISHGVIFAQICVIFPPQSLPLVFQK